MCICLQSFAHFDFTPAHQQIYDEALKMKLPVAESLLLKIKHQDPDNGINLYLENHIEFLKVFWSENPKQFEQVAGNFSKRIRSVELQDSQSPWYQFILAEIHIQEALIQVKFEENVSAAWNIKHAYSLLNSNKKKHPEFIPTYKSLGLLHTMIGSIPDKYRWIANIVGMKGNINTGLKELDIAIKKPNPVQLEAEIFRMLLQATLLKHPTAVYAPMEKLIKENPDNLLLVNIYGTLLNMSGRSELAQKTLINRPKGEEYAQIPNTYRIIGDTYLSKLDFENALAWYKYFVYQYHGQNYLKDVYYKMYLCHWLENDDQTETSKYIYRVKNTGKAYYDADKKALHMINTDEKPNKNLLKTRLLCDGGNYNEAEVLLQGITVNNFTNHKDQVEYFYRKARLFHLTNNLDNAIIYYNKTIDLTTVKDNYYFAPNASLQLGYIFADKKDKGKAKHFFNKALTYKGHEYKNSIDQKAKTALSDIDDL